jgi:hypothetical protein
MVMPDIWWTLATFQVVEFTSTMLCDIGGETDFLPSWHATGQFARRLVTLAIGVASSEIAAPAA